MLFINGFKGWNRGNAKILSLSEDWNSSIELIENIYEGPMIRGGSQFSIKKDRLAPALTLTNWHHLSISISRAGYAARIDGREIGSVPSNELANWGRKPAVLELGNFDGYIDEVVIRCKTDSAGAAPAQ